MEGKLLQIKRTFLRIFFYISLYEDRDSCLEGVDLKKVRHGYNIPKLNFVMEDKIESNEKKNSRI